MAGLTRLAFQGVLHGRMPRFPPRRPSPGGCTAAGWRFLVYPRSARARMFECGIQMLAFFKVPQSEGPSHYCIETSRLAGDHRNGAIGPGTYRFGARRQAVAHQGVIFSMTLFVMPRPLRCSLCYNWPFHANLMQPEQDGLKTRGRCARACKCRVSSGADHKGEPAVETKSCTSTSRFENEQFGGLPR
jgi:hypothetical protein